MMPATEPLIWDAHSCIALDPTGDLSAVLEHQRAGFHHVNLSMGMCFNSHDLVMRLLTGIGAKAAAPNSGFSLCHDVASVQRARADGKLSISFDLEGLAMLEGDISRLDQYYALGVRQALLAYNRDNALSGGCQGSGAGLTQFGRDIVKRMDQLGIILDCTHMSKAAALEAAALYTRPPIYSHGGVLALHDHPRNIDDEQIDLCAQAGGVMGICGISVFLGGKPNGARIAEHIDYIVQRVGPRHVGIGLDYCYDNGVSEMPEDIVVEDWWPASLGYTGSDLDDNDANVSQKSSDTGVPIVTNAMFAPPSIRRDVITALKDYGYDDKALANIQGENFARIATAVWQG
jgi:membrane dipeptidase